MNTRKKIYLFLVMIVFFLPTILVAQWIEANGLEGIANTISINEANIFVGTFGGVFRSTDTGGTWEKETTGLRNNSNVLSIAIDRSNVYAGTDGGGVFHSTDNGKSWSATNLQNAYVRALVVSSDSTATVFAGTYIGVFYTTDKGLSWTAVGTGIPNIDIFSLIFCGKTLCAGTGSGVYRSKDNGISWTASGLTNSIVRSLTLDPNSSANAFAGTGSGVFYSTDSCLSWKAVNTGLTNINIHSLISTGTKVFAGTDNGIFLSTNNGTTWDAGGLSSSVIFCLSAIEGNLFAGTNGAVFSSTNNGMYWTSILTRLPNVNVRTLHINGNFLFAGTLGSGVFYSTDNGMNWFTTESTGNVYSFANINAHLFAGTGSGLFISTDNGTQWSTALLPSPPGSVKALAVIDSIIFAGLRDNGGGGGGVYLSNDKGKSWKLVNDSVTDICCLEVNDENLYVGTDQGVFLSTDNGTTWTGSIAGLINIRVLSLCASGPKVFAGTNGQGVFLSTDDGTTWTAVNNGLSNFDVWSLALYSGNLFAGTWGGVFLSTDDGTSWNNVSKGLADTNIYSLATRRTDLFVGGGSGIWRRPLSEMITAVKDNGNNIPVSFSLSQNYPNPFNPSTIINYQLPRNTFVTLVVYDMLGRMVRTLVDEQQNAGSHSVLFSGSSLASGVYFYRLTAGILVNTKKLMLIK